MFCVRFVLFIWHMAIRGVGADTVRARSTLECIGVIAEDCPATGKGETVDEVENSTDSLPCKIAEYFLFCCAVESAWYEVRLASHL